MGIAKTSLFAWALTIVGSGQGPGVLTLVYGVAATTLVLVYALPSLRAP